MLRSLQTSALSLALSTSSCITYHVATDQPTTDGYLTATGLELATIGVIGLVNADEIEDTEAQYGASGGDYAAGFLAPLLYVPILDMAAALVVWRFRQL